jgi:hypothetical protein
MTSHHKRKHDAIGAPTTAVFDEAQNHIAQLIASSSLNVSSDVNSSSSTAVAQLRHWNRAGVFFSKKKYLLLFCFDFFFFFGIV